jgi:hypothetical protein
MEQTDKPKTGLGRDDDGNVDDKRIMAWIAFGVVMAIAIAGAVLGFKQAVEIVNALKWIPVVLAVPTVAEKFRGRMAK